MLHEYLNISYLIFLLAIKAPYLRVNTSTLGQVGYTSPLHRGPRMCPWQPQTREGIINGLHNALQLTECPHLHYLMDPLGQFCESRKNRRKYSCFLVKQITAQRFWVVHPAQPGSYGTGTQTQDFLSKSQPISWPPHMLAIEVIMP